MKILGIETSCDETAAAIVEDGVKVISEAVASSRELHEKTGGIVPEIAARKQVEFIVPVLDLTLQKAGISRESASREIAAIAVTVGPGLIGSLIVGVSAAKALGVAWELPVIPVNHLVGHIYGNFVEYSNFSPIKIDFPAVGLIVSGGHTDLVLMRGHGDLVYLGGTVDDAAGEAFDKTARLLGIADYLGGAKLSLIAAKCEHNTLAGKFPRPKITDEDFDFSFSGLKTAVKRGVEHDNLLENYPPEVIACEFESAVVDVLVKKTCVAAEKYNARTILLGGGVSANTQLRSRMKLAAKNIGIPVSIPPIGLCTDNAIYIASAAYFNNKPKALADINVNPSLGITE